MKLETQKWSHVLEQASLATISGHARKWGTHHDEVSEEESS